jgi:hypothetical protein
MGAQVIESTGAEIPARRMHFDPHNWHAYAISALSRSPQSFATAIRADVAEAEAYREALLRGEIGLQRPMGANVSGVDFITATRGGATGVSEVVCTDVKSSGAGRFRPPKSTIPGTWLVEVLDAVSPGRLELRVQYTDVPRPSLHLLPIPQTRAELAALEDAIVQAVRQDRVRLRQLNADYSASGQGRITGW